MAFLLSFTLTNGPLVEISLRNETIVSGNMLSHLSSTHCKLIFSVLLLLSIVWECISGSMTMISKGVSELGCVRSSLGDVGLSIDGPEGSPWHNSITGGHISDNGLVLRSPVQFWIDVFRNCLTSCCKWHRLESATWFDAIRSVESTSHGFGKLLVSSKFGAIEELGFVDEFVAQHGVHTFSWNLILPKLHVVILVLVINRLETAIVWQYFCAIGFFSSCILIIITVQTCLTWLKNRVWFVTIYQNNKLIKTKLRTYPYDLNPA